MSQSGQGSFPARRLIIRGAVQGVGYRAWAAAEAARLGLRGWARNRGDETVEVLAIGNSQAIALLIEACHQGPSYASVVAVEVSEADDDRSTGFRTIASL